MSTADAGCIVSKGPRLVRTLLIVNFSLFILAIGPGTSHQLDLDLRRLGIAELIGRSVQVWAVGSTLVATIMFPLIVWKKRKVAPPAFAGLEVEGMLLVLWWMTLIGLCVYGYAIGHGG